MDAQGMLDNTVVIFASDNGGCYGAGGKNGPQRGTKGSLFEGGIRVDSFMWSPLLPSDLRGSQYTNIFHISDWFPTILSMTGIEFTPVTGYELDGVDHLPAIFGDVSDTPRTHLLYNYYYDYDRYEFDMWINGSFAVRNEQYKLMHAFNSSYYALWYEPEDILEDDDGITVETRCSSTMDSDGEFTYWLFDLIEDPYEKVNLYDSTDSAIVAAKEELYDKLTEYAARARTVPFDFDPNLYSLKVWRAHDNMMVPYVNEDDLDPSDSSYPKDCYPYVSDDKATRSPTTQTTHKVHL